MGVEKLKNVIKSYKTPILYGGSSILKILAAMVSGFIIARHISPDDLGLWAVIYLALTYSLFLQGGIINGLNLELPLAYGRSQNEYAGKMAGVAQTFSVSISILVLIAGLICALILRSHDRKIINGTLSITMIIALTFYQNYLISTFRSKNSFNRLSIVQIADTCITVISLILVVRFAYNGMIARAALMLFISVMLLHIFRPVKVGFLWDKAVLLKLIKTGIPIFALAYLEFTALTFDRIWLTKYSTITNVGFYAFSLYAFNLFTAFSASVASYIYPRMSYDYGKTGDKTALWHKAKKITFFLAVFQLPLMAIGFFIIPFVVKALFSDYIPSIKSMQLLLIAGYFKGCVAAVNAVWSIKSWRHMIFFQTAYAIMLVLFTFMGVYFFQEKIVGAAAGILLANILAFFSGICVTYLATHGGNKEMPAMNG